MPNSKASDIVTIRKMLATHGPEFLETCCSRLPKARNHFLSATPSEWIANALEIEIFQAAAGMLFPGETGAVEKLAREVAKIHFSGVYKAFLQIASVSFIIRHLPMIWGTFFDQGELRAQDFTGRSGTLIVTGFPELSETHRRYLDGFYAGILDLTHARNIRITRDDSEPGAWKWNFLWE